MRLIHKLTQLDVDSLGKHIECLNFANYIHSKLFIEYEQMFIKYQKRKILGNDIYKILKDLFNFIIVKYTVDLPKGSSGKGYMIVNNEKGIEYNSTLLIDDNPVILKCIHPYLTNNGSVIIVNYKITLISHDLYTTLTVPYLFCHTVNGYISSYTNPDNFKYGYINPSMAVNYNRELSNLSDALHTIEYRIFTIGNDLGITSDSYNLYGRVNPRYGEVKSIEK